MRCRGKAKFQTKAKSILRTNVPKMLSTGIFFLAFAYYEGDRGVKIDRIKAYAWFSQINQKDMLDKLRSSFQPEQLDAAEKEAKRIKDELESRNLN